MSDPRGAATFRTSADTYDRYIGRYAPELARTLVEAAGVRPGGGRSTSAAGRAR